MKFGHLSDIGEITPSIFRRLEARDRARVFLTLYNASVSKELKVPLGYAKFGSIEQIFAKYIEQILAQKPLNFKRANSFCLVSNAIIHAFKSRDFSRLKFSAKEPKHPAAKLIKMLYISGKFELCLDAAEMFKEFVFDKLSKKHHDKEVVLQSGIISIKQKGNTLISVLPSFKHVNLDDTRNLSDEINLAVSALNSKKHEKIYIVFPRNDEFRRHIEVRHCECANGSIKLVPYTISNQIF